MKLKPGIRSWEPRYARSFPPLNMIFEMKNEKLFSDNALLYQGILKYGIDHAKDDGNGFRFTDMANWLIQKLPEFVNYYSGSKAKTPLSARLASRRDRIKQHFVYLFNMDLIHVKKMVHAQKNKREIIPLYELTTEGQFLTWIMEARNPEENDVRESTSFF